MTPDPKESVRKLAGQFQIQVPEETVTSACLTSDQLLAAAKEHTGDHPHLASCPACAELCQKLQQQLETEGGLMAFLTAVRAEASRYEQQRGSRWFSRVWAYFAVTRSGRLAAAVVTLSIVLLATAVIWDRAFAPRPNPRFTSVFEPEVYTRAVEKLNAFIGEMRMGRVRAEGLKQRISDIRSVVDQALDQDLTDEQRAEITNLLKAEVAIAKNNYSVAIDQASKVHAADSVSKLLDSLSQIEPSRSWTAVSVSVKEDKVEKVILKTSEPVSIIPPPFDQDSATLMLKSYSAREGASIEWQNVASFAPRQQPVPFKAGLR